MPEEPTAAVVFSFYGPSRSPGSAIACGSTLDPDATGEATVDTDGWPAGEYWYEATFGGDPHLEKVTVRGGFTLVDVEPAGR